MKNIMNVVLLAKRTARINQSSVRSNVWPDVSVRKVSFEKVMNEVHAFDVINALVERMKNSIHVVPLALILVEYDQSAVQNNVYQVVFVVMALFWQIIDRVVSVFLHLNAIILSVKIRMQNTWIVVRHVL